MFDTEVIGEEVKIQVNVNENYSETFFDAKGQVEIVGLVGENGTGKSSVLLELFDGINNETIFTQSYKRLVIYGNESELYYYKSTDLACKVDYIGTVKNISKVDRISNFDYVKILAKENLEIPYGDILLENPALTVNHIISDYNIKDYFKPLITRSMLDRFTKMPSNVQKIEDNKRKINKILNSYRHINSDMFDCYTIAYLYANSEN